MFWIINIYRKVIRAWWILTEVIYHSSASSTPQRDGSSSTWDVQDTLSRQGWIHDTQVCWVTPPDQTVLDTGPRARQLCAHPTFSEIVLKGHEQKQLESNPSWEKNLNSPSRTEQLHLTKLHFTSDPYKQLTTNSITQPPLGRGI